MSNTAGQGNADYKADREREEQKRQLIMALVEVFGQHKYPNPYFAVGVPLWASKKQIEEAYNKRLKDLKVKEKDNSYWYSFKNYNSEIFAYLEYSRTILLNPKYRRKHLAKFFFPHLRWSIQTEYKKFETWKENDAPEIMLLWGAAIGLVIAIFTLCILVWPNKFTFISNAAWFVNTKAYVGNLILVIISLGVAIPTLLYGLLVLPFTATVLSWIPVASIWRGDGYMAKRPVFSPPLYLIGAGICAGLGYYLPKYLVYNFLVPSFVTLTGSTTPIDTLVWMHILGIIVFIVWAFVGLRKNEVLKAFLGAVIVVGISSFMAIPAICVLIYAVVYIIYTALKLIVHW